MHLEDQTAIVTGGAQGLGRAIGRALCEAGAQVVLADIEAEAADRTARSLRDDGLAAYATEVDVVSSDSVDRLVSSTAERYGGIDILVNSAGTAAPAPFVELSERDWNRVLATNLTGPFLCGQRVARQMLSRGRGRIVNIASVVAELAHPTQAANCASKAGLLLLTRVMAAELGNFGITVNAVSPGTVETERWHQLRIENPRFTEGRLEASPTGRLVQPHEVAAAVVFLCGADAAGINGTNLVVDGGSAALWAGAVPALRHASRSDARLG